MKLIKMLKTKKGSEDGLKVKSYEAEKTYKVSPSLAEVFLKNGWAETFDQDLSKKQDLGKAPKVKKAKSKASK